MKSPKTLTFVVLAAGLIFAQAAWAQQKPLTQDQVQTLVRSGLGDESGVKLVEQRGIDFVPADDFIETLKSAGASEAFLQALRTAKPDEAASAKKSLNANDRFNSGNAKAASGDWDGAIEEYNEAIEVKPDFPAAYYNRGNVKHAKGDLDGAIADFSQAIELKPDLSDAYNNRGYLKKAKGDLDGAVADFSKAIEINPDLALAYINRGDAKQAKGDMNGASTDYTKAAEKETKSRESPPQALANLSTPPGTGQAGVPVAVQTQPTEPGGETLPPPAQTNPAQLGSAVGARATASVLAGQTPVIDLKPGTYYQSSNSIVRMEVLSMTNTSMKGTGKLYSPIPVGMPHMVYTFRGAHADLQTDATPTFYVVQSPYLTDIPGRSMRDMTIIRLDTKKDRRELPMESGVNKERMPEIVARRISESVFTVSAVSLKPGEYILSFGVYGGSGWDFSVPK